MRFNLNACHVSCVRTILPFIRIILRLPEEAVQRHGVGGLPSIFTTYTFAVSRPSHARPSPSVWARLAAFLGFLAVLSALAAPVSMLAEEVRTGQLGGICSLNSAASGSNADAGSGDAPQAGSRCDLCGALGWALPPLAVSVLPTFAGQQVAAQDVPANLAAVVAGLPFSRGPPPL